MTTEQAIETILKEQINSYKVLHDVLKQERLCLVKIDVDQVEKISKEKDTVVMKLRLLEEERQRLIKKFIRDNDLPDDINLNDLAKFTGNTLFKELRSKLLSLLQVIEEMNKFNSILINKSINHVKTSTRFMNVFQTERSLQNRGTLLSKET